MSVKARAADGRLLYTYIVNSDVLGRKSGREVILYTCLLTTDEAGHVFIDETLKKVITGVVAYIHRSMSPSLMTELGHAPSLFRVTRQ
jgi:hypothetical protein